MLTHELAEGTYDPYLADMLAPLRPVLCFGRSAKAFPSTKPSHAVMSWWREPHENPGYRVHTQRPPSPPPALGPPVPTDGGGCSGRRRDKKNPLAPPGVNKK